jgi:hypothetical protein
MKISEETKVSTDIKSLVGIIAGVAIGVWAYFGVIERLNNLETKNQLFEQDLLEASSQKPIDQEQFMLIEDLYKTVEKLQSTQEMNMTNKVNIQFLQKQMEKALIDIERLKDSNREMKYTNGH